MAIVRHSVDLYEGKRVEPKPRHGRGLGKNGEKGIRTPGTSCNSYIGLANRRLQPLGHLSFFGISDYRLVRRRSIETGAGAGMMQGWCVWLLMVGRTRRSRD